MTEIQKNNKEILQLIEIWEPKLLSLPNDIITSRRNSQNRTIKQIVGHMVDSASNNTHRTVYLQYQKSPFYFPNYATHGNNDRWIAIQNYQDEDWKSLVQLWKYANIHIVHVFNNVDASKLNNEWQDDDKRYNFRDCIIDYLRHFKLHLSEIEDLINK